MSNSQKILNEIIEISKADITDLIIDEMKFGEILDNIHNQKKSTSLKLDIPNKPKKEINILSSIKKPVSKEIIKEEAFSEEEDNEEEENLILEQDKNIKLNNNKNLFLNLKSKDSIIEIPDDEFILDYNLKNCESDKEKSKEIIDKIFEFIDIEENDFQKYLLDNKIIEEEKEENDIDNEEQEEDNEIEEFTIEEKEENDNKEENKIVNEIIIESDNKNKKETKDEKSDINKENISSDFVIINENENETQNKNNEMNNNINDYKDTKLYLIEKTENFSFMNEKDNSELSHYLNNNPNKSSNSEETSKKYKIFYEITQFHKKEILHNNFLNIRITCLFIDDIYIYLGDGGGNLLIYSLKEEKLLKTLVNPFDIENKKKLDILSIDSDENYIIAGYQRGKIVLYEKKDKNICKAKIFEIFYDITKEDIIEIKIYSKLNNEIIIYFSDNKENIHKIEIIKNKIFKNKILERKITAELKNSKKREPYYNISINPFDYKCIGVVNNNSVSIYIVVKFDKNVIFTLPNEDPNSFLSFCFSQKKEEKNKFYISNSKILYIYELGENYKGAAPLNRFVLEENIINIGFFKDELIYAYTEKNNIKLICFNEKNKENDGTYQFIDTINIDNDNIDKNSNDNATFLINFKSHLSTYDGKMFLYHKNSVLYLEILPFHEGLNKLYNKTLVINDQHIWDVLFKIISEIKNKKHQIWTNTDSKKFYDLVFNYSQSYISLLIIQLGENKSKEEIEKIKFEFNKLMKYLIEIEFYDFILNEKKGLYSMLIESKLNDFYFYLLEPFIIQDKFINEKNIKKAFMLNLIRSYLNKDNTFITLSNSWLSEILMHFPIKSIMQIEKEIIEKYLINVIINIIINNKLNLTGNYFIDFCTPLNLIMQLLREKFTAIDLNNDELFRKENRYKDNIVLSNDYLRLKLIWYIVYVIKNKILDEKDIKKDKKIKTLFVKGILKLLNEEDRLYLLIFNEVENKKQNEQSYFYIKEILFVYQIFFDNAEALSNFHEINRETLFKNMREKLEKRKEFEVDLKIFTIKNILKENITDIANDEKLNLIFYFMENHIQLFDEYPEIKEAEFEKSLIEILKLTDSITFNDSEKLIKFVNKCKDNYKQLGEYILHNFNKK